MATTGCAVFNDNAVAALEMAYPGRGTVYQYDVFDYHQDLVGSYDFAMLIDVIEHVEDPAAFFRECAQGWHDPSPSLFCLARAGDRGHRTLQHRLGPGNPSALPRNYPAGLAVILGLIWLGTGIMFVLKSLTVESPHE